MAAILFEGGGGVIRWYLSPIANEASPVKVYRWITWNHLY